MNNHRLVAIMLLLLSSPMVAHTAALSKDDFLRQVEEKNQSITASKLIVNGTSERANEGKLLFKPNFFAQAQTSADKKPTTNLGSQGDRTDYQLLKAGISEQFNFGLQTQLSYTTSHTKIYDSSPIYLPVSSFNDGAATLEITQSLWRNFLGSETQSMEAAITAQSQASKHTENFKIKSLLSQAETLYWSLSQMRKVVQVEKESLERARKIREWAQNRLKSGLAESADFLQADANYKARDYELKSSLQDLKNLQRSVNSLRGIDGDVIDEDLEAVNSANIKTLSTPKKEDLRDDTKAALELEKITRANAEVSIQKNKPTFELYGSYTLNGRDPNKSEAISNSFKTDHDTKAIGLRFNAPIDFMSTSDNISGYKNEQIAAKENYQRKFFEQEQSWNDLVSKLEDAKIKLALIEKIEEAQKIKATNERDRLNRGRTTTFQVLNFEQDYAQSQLSRIQSETNILNIYAQLKVFNAGGIQ